MLPDYETTGFFGIPKYRRSIRLPDGVAIHRKRGTHDFLCGRTFVTLPSSNHPIEMAGLQQHSRCFAYNESTVRVKSRSGHAAASELRLGLRCLLTGLLLLCGALNALEPGHSITQYAHKGWTRQEGQLKGSVFALTQTSDGNLWLGTEFVLLRFDGVRRRTTI